MPDDQVDLDLDPQDLANSRTAKTLTTFIARLRYDPEGRRRHLWCLGIENDDIAQQVRATYGIGVDLEGGDVVVYRFEVRSITRSRSMRRRGPFQGSATSCPCSS
jgi:hypothetical protein